MEGEIAPQRDIIATTGQGFNRSNGGGFLLLGIRKDEPLVDRILLCAPLPRKLQQKLALLAEILPMRVRHPECHSDIQLELF